ncbi:carotenoid biosynthesis protein [Algoriphagus sp. NF]|mgnify:FL=1|jgi:putative membrane protein|uniref:Carotenoid biosynthesis protein n=1 Tax=Algoriphagus marincola TaxID=264027 RepID=A0ABS7N5S3_9BACT|nr:MULTISPECIES: carotenoid biosynthesis protein [Algoriphagus]MBY5951694.1 carotenoid biosynthesis protein [Algoriphagus marincola]MCR9082229.1 carotenoid biosynthesis protein [Cyclobacteriaceae bacterium]MDE0561132.1 carotenoid biosynthesis protein [Algoriphagus sp. NF]
MHQVVPERGSGYTLRLTIARIVILVLHGVGILGLSLPEYQDWFLALTPVQLLSSLLIILLFHRGWNDSFPIFAAAAFWIGFGAELIGIHTGYLFGDYVYGPTLGPKLWDVPIIIGVNWFILAYLTGSVFRKIPNDYYAAFLGALAMTALDYIIEPVAVALDFWYWKFDVIPVENYLGWFGVSFVVHLIFRKANFEKFNPIALLLLLTLIVFFTVLNFTVV